MNPRQLDNLFKPGSGGMPPYLAGREREQAQLSRALDAVVAGETFPSDIVLYGPRGNGKTVLLNWFRREIQKRAPNKAYVTQTTPGEGLRTGQDVWDLLLPASWRDLLPQEFSAGTGVASANWRLPVSSTNELRERLVSECKKQPRILLVDEAHTLEADVCRYLLNLSQAVRGEAPFLLILAGTPGLRDLLQTVQATFSERSEMVGIGRLDEQSAGEAIRQPLAGVGISIDGAALAEVVQDSQQYPYFLQLWGRALCEVAVADQVEALTTGHVARAGEEVELIKRNFYRNRYEGLDTPRLRPVAEAVSAAFRNGELLNSSSLQQVVANALPAENADQAKEILRELQRLDFVWESPRSQWCEPGIPSMMAFVLSRQQERLALEQSGPKAPLP